MVGSYGYWRLSTNGGSEYVGQLQTQMDQRESDWWEKQLGKTVAAGGSD